MTIIEIMFLHYKSTLAMQLAYETHKNDSVDIWIPGPLSGHPSRMTSLLYTRKMSTRATRKMQ